MRLVVADTSPLRYLLQIEQIDLLPRLFEKIFIPSVVYDELGHPSAPEAVRTWTRSRPDWLEVSVISASDDPSLDALDEGEKSAIALGLSLSADLLLIDDRKGAAIARGKGFEVTGRLGILDLAARAAVWSTWLMPSRASALRTSAGAKNFSMRCSSSTSGVAVAEGSAARWRLRCLLGPVNDRAPLLHGAVSQEQVDEILVRNP